ncbi:MAG: hypothetical protein QXE84_08830, partial [Candidatus Nitrosotenuis sp.]
GQEHQYKFWAQQIRLEDDVQVQRVFFSHSKDYGKTFSEPQLIFEVDWDLSPYEDRPTPILEVDADKVTITWKMRNESDQDSIWKAVDYGKDGNFEVTNYLENNK